MESLDQLTGREIEILKRLAAGSSDQEIADALFLSLNTVKWYNRKIYEKLDVSSRTQAIARSRELLLFEDKAPASPVPEPASSLPAEITRFIGRARECAEIDRLLQKHRLVTLAGPPGSGKTRLALHAARELAQQFRDGVYFVPLGALPSPDGILWAVAEHLDFQFQAAGEPRRQLLHFLREKSLLLALDNFEHLIAGGGLLAEILEADPGVKILVTSRERLGLYGETVYTLGGMLLPDESAGQGEEALRSEAVELFIERAEAASPNRTWKPGDLRHIARICRLVDGMPLGIELAATWMDTLMPEEIAAEIERNLDILEAEHPAVPHAQRSIRAAFERSWTLLDEDQKAVFRRLSVFRGGFTREAGEAVAGIGLRHLQALVNKSLLRRSPHTGRYDIHELLRFYAGEQLETSGEVAAVTRAHAAYFAEFMAERWYWMTDYRQKPALDEMEADIDNVRAAWQYWINAGDIAQVKKFLHGFWAIYDVRGWYPAGIELFEQAARLMRSTGTREAEECLGWLLAVQGLFSVPVADYDPTVDTGTNPVFVEHGLYSEQDAGPRRGLELAQRGIQSLRQTGAGDAMMVLPLISVFITASQVLGEKETAMRAARECLEVATRLDDHWAIAKAQQFLAVRAIEDGDYAQAERLAGEAYRSFQSCGNHWSSSVVCIEVLSLLAITQRQFQTARDWIVRGLRDAEEIDFKYSIQTAYWQLGYVAALEENYAEAGKYWQKALSISERMLGGRSFIGLGSASRAGKP